MKPKHRVYCAYAGRHKMLFETKEKAVRFIRLNASEFEDGFRPNRTYWCGACGGWHVTHKPKIIKQTNN